MDATPEMVSLTPKIGTDADSAKGAGASARGAADRRGLGRVLDVLLALAKVRSHSVSHTRFRLRFTRQSEHALLGTVFASLPASQRTSLYSSLLGPSLTLLTNTGQSLNSLIKKSTHYALVPIAFATFQELQERQGEFEEWARTKAGRKENEVGDLTHAFRGTCLTSLPGIIEETKVRADIVLILRALGGFRTLLIVHSCARSLGATRRLSVQTRFQPLSALSRST